MGSIIEDMVRVDARKAALAELVGTFFLTFAALASRSPYAVALTLAAFVYAIGNISGCNLNPGVTVGLMSARRLSVGTGILYIIAQIAGAILARTAVAQTSLLAPHYAAASPFLEFFGFAFLILTVIALSQNFVPSAGSGIAIGAALAAGLITSRGIINPAIAIAMGQTFSGAFWAPLLSAVACVTLFQIIKPDDAPSEETPSDDSAEKSTPAAVKSSESQSSQTPLEAVASAIFTGTSASMPPASKVDKTGSPHGESYSESHGLDSEKMALPSDEAADKAVWPPLWSRIEEK